MMDFIARSFKKSKFEISINVANQYYWKLKAPNGEIILMSEFYQNKQGCENGIQSVKENAKLEHHFDIKVSKDKKRYFTLKAQNGEIIGTSETYNNLSGVINGIESVIKWSQTNIIVFD